MLQATGADEYRTQFVRDISLCKARRAKMSRGRGQTHHRPPSANRSGGCACATISHHFVQSADNLGLQGSDSPKYACCSEFSILAY